MPGDAGLAVMFMTPAPVGPGGGAIGTCTHDHVLHTDVFGNVTGTRDWTRLSGMFTAPAGALAVRFSLFTDADPDGDGAVWFDDAALCNSE